MEKNLHHLSKGKFKKITVEHDLENHINSEDLYVYDLVTKDKKEAIEELKKLGINDIIFEKILNPFSFFINFKNV